MRIALVDSNPKTKLYPLPLLKIGAWRKALGDECVLFDNVPPPAGEFDEIWITTVFTFHLPHSLALVDESKKRAPVVRVGGVAASLLPSHFQRAGAEVHRGLIPDAEEMSPDFDLLPSPPDFSIIHTSRGCVRTCDFCMVPKLEGGFVRRPGWERDIAPGSKALVFYDNNWLVNSPTRLASDVKEIRGICDRFGITSVDFNQGLDARLMSEKKADTIMALPIKPYRFAFDDMSEDGWVQNAMRWMADRGGNEFMSYVLWNFEDTPADLWYRLRCHADMTEELRAKHKRPIRCKAFPMRFQPILEVNAQRDYVGRNWTARKRKGFLAMMHGHSTHGTVSCLGGDVMTPSEEFEFFFGKTADEFVRMLDFPDITKLMQRRKGELRQRRLRAKQKRARDKAAAEAVAA